MPTSLEGQGHQVERKLRLLGDVFVLKMLLQVERNAIDVN